MPFPACQLNADMIQLLDHPSLWCRQTKPTSGSGESQNEPQEGSHDGDQDLDDDADSHASGSWLVDDEENQMPGQSFRLRHVRFLYVPYPGAQSVSYLGVEF